MGDFNISQFLLLEYAQEVLPRTERNFSDYLTRAVEERVLYKEEAKELYLQWLPLDRIVPNPLRR